MQLIDSFSGPGAPGKPNEDRCGHAGDYAWVIDGATGLAKQQYVAKDGQTDAAWLTENLNIYLQKHAPSCQGDMMQLLKDAQLYLKDLYDQQAIATPAIAEEYPTAALRIIRHHDGMVEGYYLADCSLVGGNDQNVFSHAGDPDILRLADMQKQEMARLMGDEDMSFDDMRAKILPTLQDTRRLMNTPLDAPDGYGVFAIHHDFTHRALHSQHKVEQDDHILLMSDGYYAAVDMYGLYTDSGLLNAVKAKGLSHVYNEIRETEDKDPHAKTFTRFKKGDDATAILLKI
jgi:hypothetical protein